jgi:hypothetical protein
MAGSRGKRDGTVQKKGESMKDRDLEHASNRSFEEAAPQETKYNYTTFEGISQ